MPEDFTARAQGNFTITNNWSIYDARLKIRRVDQPISELFVNAGMDVECMRDAKTFMKHSVDACYDEYAKIFPYMLKWHERGGEVIFGRWPDERQVNRANEVAE